MIDAFERELARQARGRSRRGRDVRGRRLPQRHQHGLRRAPATARRAVRLRRSPRSTSRSPGGCSSAIPGLSIVSVFGMAVGIAVATRRLHRRRHADGYAAAAAGRRSRRVDRQHGRLHQQPRVPPCPTITPTWRAHGVDAGRRHRSRTVTRNLIIEGRTPEPVTVAEIVPVGVSRRAVSAPCAAGT